VITSIIGLTEGGDPTLPQVSNEVIFISDTLSLLRDAEEISNDAFLEAGMIQGGLSILSSMIMNGSNDQEISAQIKSMISKAEALRSRFPELDAKIESHR
jgi:hypothetical protein